MGTSLDKRFYCSMDIWVEGLTESFLAGWKGGMKNRKVSLLDVWVDS